MIVKNPETLPELYFKRLFPNEEYNEEKLYKHMKESKFWNYIAQIDESKGLMMENGAKY